MKYLNMLMITSLVVCVAILASCSQEAEPATNQDEQDVLITIGAGSRAQISPDIESLRLLGYKTSNGVLAFNELIINDQYSVLNEYRVKVKKGEFTIVLIANEKKDQVLQAALADDNKIYTIHDLKRLSFDSSKIGGYIPMISINENVNIIADDKLEHKSVTYTADNIWSAELVRLGVKVYLHLLVPENDALIGPWIYCYYNNIPTQVFLFPGIDNSAYLKNDYTYNTIGRFGDAIRPESGDITLANKTTKPVPDGYSYYGVGYTILPESYFSTATNKGIKLVVHDGTGANSREGKISIDTGYNLPRNTFVEVIATVSATDEEIDFDVRVGDWEDKNINNVEFY